MKLKSVCKILALLLIFQIPVFCQTINISKILEETQSVARKTGFQDYYEFSQSFKTTIEDKKGNKSTKTYESVCSSRAAKCEIILIEENGIVLSEKEIRKNREKATEKLQKAEISENEVNFNKEISNGYGFSINTWFSPILYLKSCDVVTPENTVFENRPTIKVRVRNCRVDDHNKNVQFMNKTEGIIWIDVQEKAIVKMEAYAAKEFINVSAAEKPVFIMETVRVPEGFWFWKTVRVNALENTKIFTEYSRNWQIDFFNYKHFTVNVDKTEIGKP